MVASALSISGPNIVLNTIVAEALSQIADRLEKSTDFRKDLQALLKEIATKHKRILFDGNNYADEWTEEAAKRGLPNVTSMVKPCPPLSAKNRSIFLQNIRYSARKNCIPVRNLPGTIL